MTEPTPTMQEENTMEVNGDVKGRDAKLEETLPPPHHQKTPEHDGVTCTTKNTNSLQPLIHTPYHHIPTRSDHPAFSLNIATDTHSKSLYIPSPLNT